MIKEKIKQWKDDRKRLSTIERKKKDAYFDSLEEEAAPMGKIQAKLERVHRAELYKKKLENLREDLEMKRLKQIEKKEKGYPEIDLFGLHKNDKDNHNHFNENNEQTFDLFARNI